MRSSKQRRRRLVILLLDEEVVVDEGTVRMLAGVESEVAALEALKMTVMGMCVANETCVANGEVPAYDESHFANAAFEAEAISARLKTY